MITNLNENVKIKQTLIQMNKNIKQFEAKVDKKLTYAQTAQTIAMNSTKIKINSDNIIALKIIEKTRKMKIIILKITDAKKKKTFRLKHTKNILNKLSRAMRKEKKPTDIRRFLSGDIELQMTSVKNKK